MHPCMYVYAYICTDACMHACIYIHAWMHQSRFIAMYHVQYVIVVQRCMLWLPSAYIAVYCCAGILILCRRSIYCRAGFIALVYYRADILSHRHIIASIYASYRHIIVPIYASYRYILSVYILPCTSVIHTILIVMAKSCDK